MTRDAGGGAFVGWIDNRRGEPDLYVQRFTASRAVADRWPADDVRVSASGGSRYQLDVAPDGNGGVFLAWQDYRDRHLGRVYIQRITGEGQVASGWPAGGRAICPGSAEQSSPHLAADGSGGVYVIWRDRVSGRARLHLGRIFAHGDTVAGWPAAGKPISTGPNNVQAATIFSDSLGRCVIVWQQADTLGVRSLLGMRISPDMNPSTGWDASPATLVESATNLTPPVLEHVGTDHVLAVWGEWQVAGSALRAKRLSLGGPWTGPLGGAVIHAGVIGHGPPSVLADGSGGAFVAWEGYAGPGSDSDIRVSRITSTGTLAAGWDSTGASATVAAGAQYAPALASDGAGGVIVTWIDPPRQASASVLAAARVGKVSLQLLEAKATAGRARITWQMSGTSDSLEVERLVPKGEWAVIARVAPDDSGLVAVDDRRAVEGTRVEYRLVWTVEGMRFTFPAVALDIPRRPAVLAIQWVRPEPARNAIVLSLALPSGEGTDLQLHDVAGRRIATQRVDGLEPGEHEVTFSLSGRVASGIYFVRVLHVGKARTKKVAFVR